MPISWEEMQKRHGPQGAVYDGKTKRTIDDQRPFTRVQPGETTAQKETRLLGMGWHPTGVDRLLEQDGTTPTLCCKDCRHFVDSPWKYDSRRFFKCALMRDRWSGGRATDCLAGWPACMKFEGRDGAAPDTDADGDSPATIGAEPGQRTES